MKKNNNTMRIVALILALMMIVPFILRLVIS